MHLFAQTIVLGILIGGIYSLLAAGLTLVFGVMRVANFAHGALYMLGAYAAYYVNIRLGLPMGIALIAATAFGGMFGYGISSVLLRPVHRGVIDQPGNYVLIITFGLTLLVGAALVAIAGPEGHSVQGFWNTNLAIGSWLRFSGDRIVAFGGAVALIGALVWLVYHTDIGRGWRALTQNRLGATVVGVDAVRLSHLAFATSAGLAGAAGALVAPLYHVDPGIGEEALIKSFVIVIVAGLGSIAGALTVGLGLGVLEATGSIYISATYRDAYGFLLMILVLLLRPQGLFGRRLRAL